MIDIGVGDKGWDFLSMPRPEDGESIWDSVDGCEVNDDGSKSYRDREGGWGYRAADGSGSYTGANGSRGTWYSDGSFSYSGADGTRATGYSDGSGSYDGADGSRGRWYSDSEYTIDFSSGGRESGFAKDNGGFIDFSGRARYAGYDGSSADEVSHYTYGVDAPRFTIPISVPDETVAKLRVTGEYIGQIAAAKSQIYHYEAKERRRRFLSRHWKKLLVFISALLIVCMAGFLVMELQRMTRVGVNASDAVGRPYADVMAEFERSGFTNVSSEPLKDLSPKNEGMEGEVNDVNILGNESFDENTSYPYDVPVVVHYHSVRVANPPGLIKVPVW